MANILFIEDDQFVAEMYGRSLLRAGHTVRLTSDPQQVGELCQKNTYDYVILDILLPGYSGLDLLPQLAKWRGTAAARVIILTNFEQDSESRLTATKQVYAYLIKSETPPRELIKIIS